MLFLLSGAAASGKKTVARVVASRLPNVLAHHEQEIPATNRRERMANMERWVGTALAWEAEDRDLLLLAQSPLGELLASPRAIELEGIAACVLDCHDHERSRRIAQRTPDPRWPFGMDDLCWAAWHRMHAIDPQWEQRVLRDETVAEYYWDRWMSWRRGDPRWDVTLIDTTAHTVAESVDRVCTWIERTRAEGTPLVRSVNWWD